MIAWRAAAGLSRTAFVRIRSGRDVGVVTLARLVRAARQVSGQPVSASDLYDVADDAPVGTPDPADPSVWIAAHLSARSFYDTPLDQFLLREHIKPAEVARTTSITRQALRRIRAGQELPRVSTLRNLVAALRLLTGKPIRAAELFDLGEDETRESNP